MQVGFLWVSVPLFLCLRNKASIWEQGGLEFFTAPHDAMTSKRTLLRALVHVAGIGVEMGIILTSLV